MTTSGKNHKSVSKKMLNYFCIGTYVSDRLIFKAGELKKSYRISYADAFAAAQSFVSNAQLLTTDHKEFEPLEKAKLVKIFWLR